MTTFATKSVFAGLLAAGLMLDKAPSPAAQAPPSSHTVTEAEYQRWKTDLSNWGRWGKTDEIGALNLITPAKRK